MASPAASSSLPVIRKAVRNSRGYHRSICSWLGLLTQFLDQRARCVRPGPGLRATVLDARRQPRFGDFYGFSARSDGQVYLFSDSGNPKALNQVMDLPVRPAYRYEFA